MAEIGMAVKRKRKRLRSKGVEDKALVDSEEVQELLNREVPAGEREYMNELQHMFKTLRRLIRKMERNMLLAEMPSGKDSYALSTMYSQQREIIADMRTLTDMSQQAQLLVDSVLRPMGNQLVQYTTDVFYQARKLVQETSNPKHTQRALDELGSLFKQLGIGMQASVEEAAQKTHESIAGPEDKFEKKRRRK